MNNFIRAIHLKPTHLVASALFGAGALFAQGVQSPDIAYAVATANNQVYIGGQVAGTIPGQQSFGRDDAFLQSFDQNGNVIWTAQFGSGAKDQVNGVGADATGVYGGGLTDGALPGQAYMGSTDAFVVKYDLNGNQLWLHEYGTSAVDRIQAAAAYGGFFYVTGYTAGALDGQVNLGGQDAYVQQWDSNGNLIWTTQFGTTGTDRAYGIAVNANGIFVTGRTDGAFPGQASNGGIDAFLAAFDTTGRMMWARQFGTSSDERGWGVGVDTTGVYVTGRTEGAFPGQTYLGDDDAYMIKFDFTGTQLWVNEFGTARFDRGTAVSTDSTGAYAVGYTQGTFPNKRNAGFYDVYIRKYDRVGDVLWTVEFGSAQFDAGWGTATDSTGVYVSGTAGAALPGQTGTVSNGGYFVKKFHATGSSVWVDEVSVPQ